VNRYLTKTIYIQQAWRRHHRSLEQRTYMLAVDIWKYELGQLTSYFIKKKSNASAI